MKIWIIATMILGLLLVAGVAVAFNAKSINAQTSTSTTITTAGCGCGASGGCGCGGKCTAENNCGLASCGVVSGTGSCGCNKK